MPVARRADSFGIEEPRIFTPPLRKLTPATSHGFEVITFAQDVLGLTLAPWQKWLYIHALELLPNGDYRFRTLLILVARQNGKTTWLQILALWAMYVNQCKLILGTAQNLDVSEECWEGAVEMAQGVPELLDEIDAVVRVNGKKSLKLTTGERYKVAAASRRGGRGLSGDMVFLDELREHQTWEAWGAVTKTTMARSRALIIGLSNAGDRNSIVLLHLRDVAMEAIASGDKKTKTGIFEWSAPDGCDLTDVEGWRQANPSLGYTDIGMAAIQGALETDPEAVFRTEVLCQHVEQLTPTALPNEEWIECTDPDSRIEEGAYLVFGVDVAWDESYACVVAAGVRADGLRHIEVIERREGVDWVRDYIREGARRWAPLAVTVQRRGAPASSLIGQLDDCGAPLHPLPSDQLAPAAVAFKQAVLTGRVKHLGQPALNQAVAVAVGRTVNDTWLLDRKGSADDIAPLVAATEALWVLDSLVGSSEYDPATSVH